MLSTTGDNVDQQSSHRVYLIKNDHGEYIMIERQEKIRRILSENNYVSVHKLAKMLCVSEPTVRRELAAMEKEMVVKRTYGGVMVNSDATYIPIVVRDTMAIKSKRIVASKAADMIKEGMVIFIDSSSTAKCITEYLHENLKVTIVTNSYDLCVSLVKLHIKAFCVGGYIDEADHAMRGSFATDFISHFCFDMAFFSCTALSNEGMLSGASLDGVTFLKTLLLHSQKNVLLCTKEKIGKEKPFLICSLHDIDTIITDGELPAQLISMIHKE